MTELNKGKAMHVSSEGTLVSSNEEKQLSIGEVIEDMQNRISALEATVIAQETMISAINTTANTALDKSIELGIITATVNEK